jgi:hypothetical protein
MVKTGPMEEGQVGPDTVLAVTPLSANLPLRRLQPEAELKGAHCKQQENLQ